MKRIIISNFINKEAFEITINEVLSFEYTLRYKNNLALLEVYDESENLGVPLIYSDVLMEYKIMLVPLFDDFIYSLFSYINSPGIYSAYQLLVKLLADKKIKQDEIPNYFKNIPKETIDLIKIYFETGLNASKTAKLLYMHRNTMNYRIHNFIEDTDIDIKDILNASFVYLLIAILH